MFGENVERRRVAGILLAGVSAFALAACSSSTSSESTTVAAAESSAAAPSEAASAASCEKEYTIGFSHPVGEAGFVKALKSRVESVAEENGCVTVLFDNTTANNLESQRSTLESWVTQGVDAIVVLPVDAGALSAVQKQAQTDGIKWLTYAFKGEGADGSTGFDSVASGTAVGDYLTTWVNANYPDKDVSSMVTTLSALKAIVSGRWEKPVAALDALGIPVVSQQDCADQTCGLQITEDVLRAHPDLRIVVGLNDDAALGAAKAFENAGIDPATVLVIGQDGNPEALEAVKAGGPVKATAAINLGELAEAIVQNPLNAIEGKTPVDTQAGVTMATADDPAALEELIKSYGQ